MNVIFVPAAISTPLIVLIATLVVVTVAFTVLYFLGKRLEKKQTEQQAMMESMAQKVNLMVVDKKRMKITEAPGLPKQVAEQTPWYLKRSKVPVCKVKIGPKVVTMLCDDKVFEVIPLKQELKATVSGLYITDVKAVRGSLLTPEPKKGFFKKLFKR